MEPSGGLVLELASSLPPLFQLGGILPLYEGFGHWEVYHLNKVIDRSGGKRNDHVACFRKCKRLKSAG